MPREIEFIVEPDGTIKIEAIGFKGKGCKAATEAYEKAIGMKSKKVVDKPEIHTIDKSDVKVGR